MLKLSTLAAADTAVLELRDASDAPLLKPNRQPVTITVYGPGSKPYSAAKAAQQNRMLSKIQRGKASGDTPEEKARNEAEFLAAIVAADDGLDIEGLTEGLSGCEKYRVIFGHPPISFLGDQVAKFAADWANFSQGSAKS